MCPLGRRLWSLLKSWLRLAGVVLRGVATNLCLNVVDLHNLLKRRLSHLLFGLCRRCLYPIDLSASHIEAVSARDSILTVSTVVYSDLDLRHEPWFFRVGRREAHRMVRRGGVDGTYLVRESSSSTDSEDERHCLTVYCQGEVYHIRITRRGGDGGRFALGEHKEGEETFLTVQDLVWTHQRRPLKLVSCRTRRRGSTTAATAAAAAAARTRLTGHPCSLDDFKLGSRDLSPLTTQLSPGNI